MTLKEMLIMCLPRFECGRKDRITNVKKRIERIPIPTPSVYDADINALITSN